MSEGEGVRKSSELVIQPSGGAAAAGFRVFLSYASADAVVANQACEFLESHGVPCWMAPRDVKPGTVYADAIVRAINEAGALVLVWTVVAMPAVLVSIRRWVLPPLRSVWLSLRRLLSFWALAGCWRFDSGSRKREQSPAPAVAAISDKSIAVLPFADMSEKKDQEYFSDGMAAEIIDLLVKIPELVVPARTSSFYFKGKSTQIPEIAKELGVRNILEGSVRGRDCSAVVSVGEAGVDAVRNRIGAARYISTCGSATGARCAGSAYGG